ncbi:MAG: hypothetical protein LQ346_005165 [Caloplaca aetnensis]|nr:MAG: hypothetical protein LQ346_005165 [Caloplaca aetnensis]
MFATVSTPTALSSTFTPKLFSDYSPAQARTRKSALMNQTYAELAQNRRWLMTESERPDPERILSNSTYELLLRRFATPLRPMAKPLPNEALNIWHILEAEREAARELQGKEKGYAEDWWEGSRKKGVKPTEAKEIEKAMLERQAEIRGRMRSEGPEDATVRLAGNSLEARMDGWVERFGKLDVIDEARDEDEMFLSVEGFDDPMEEA